MTQHKNESSEKNPNPRFTGLFIPVEILEIEGLTHTDCMLLAWIDALYSKEHGGCYASNEYFVKKMKLKENTIKVLISKLEGKGLIERVSFNGRVRIIRACKEKWFNEKSQSTAEVDLNQPQTLNKINRRGLLESTPPIYRDNSIDKSIEDIVEPAGSMSAEADDLYSFFIQKLKERKPDIKIPEKPDSWKTEIDRMIRIDKRDPKKIRAMIDWIHRDIFWAANILSPKKLRQQYDQIELQAMRKHQTNASNKNKEYAMRQKQKYAETYKNLTFNEKYAINSSNGKEIPLSLPFENFTREFTKIFGINWNDLNENDKK